MTVTDNVVPIFDAEVWAEKWAAEWEADGGTMQVSYAPTTGRVSAVRTIMPRHGRVTERQLDRFLALSGQLHDAPLAAYRALIALMQCRVDDGCEVVEWSGCANDF